MEMLIGIVLIGVVSSFALLRADGAKERAYIASMKHDLRHFADVQALALHDRDHYLADPAEADDFTYSPDVRTHFATAAMDRWILAVEHANSDVICVLRAGDAAAMDNRIECGTDVISPFPVADLQVASVQPDLVVSQFPITFDASESFDNDGGEIVDYEWSFSDGATASGPVVRHTFPSAGYYDVTLTVTDDEGWTHTVSQTIESRRQWLASPTDLSNLAWESRNVNVIGTNTIEFLSANAEIWQCAEGLSEVTGENGDDWAFHTLTTEYQTYAVEKAYGDQTLRFAVRAKGEAGQQLKLRLDWNKACNNCALEELETTLGTQGTASIDIEWAVAYFVE